MLGTGELVGFGLCPSVGNRGGCCAFVQFCLTTFKSMVGNLPLGQSVGDMAYVNLTFPCVDGACLTKGS